MVDFKLHEEENARRAPSCLYRNTTGVAHNMLGDLALLSEKYLGALPKSGK